MAISELDHDRIHDLADAMAKRLREGMGYEQAMRIVFQGLRGDDRAGCIAAVASELSMRRHVSEARKRPDAPAREAASPRKPLGHTQSEQLEFPGAEFQEKAPSPTGYPSHRRAA